MNKRVERNYLEINFLKDLKDTSDFDEKYSVNLVDPVDFQLNKFFYKNIGKKSSLGGSVSLDRKTMD